jgi:4-amino-4-deoxy-L-arabinose transferase-like glycosyltransferase
MIDKTGLDCARAAVLAIAVLLLCRDVAAPFNAWHELNDAVLTQFARNHIEYGLGYTALYNTWGDTVAPPAVPQRYLSHPPLLAVWTAVPLLVFGDHEWAARLVPIAATVGSTALVMAILARLGSPLLGALAGLFFATLPLTSYFGRMIAHEAPTQLFSLLMIHGYLEWAGDYGGSGRPRRGAFVYAAGAVLGIATGWAALLAAGLLWTWHAARVARRHGEARMLLWLALVPGLALAAVVLHIAAGCGWDFGVFGALLGKRSLAGEGGRQPWSAWLGMQWLYFVRNFTWPGALAALLAVFLLPGTLLRAARGSGSSLLPLAGKAGSVAVLCALQGLVWMVGLKNQSWYHDYWQFFLAPAVALSMAGLVLSVHAGLASRAPRLAALAAVLLILSPMPFAATSRDFYAEQRLVDPESIRALSDLGRLLPHRAPVWTSHRTPESSEAFGSYTYRWPNPIVTYYANRPLFFSRDVAEVEANAPRCVAYLLKRSEQPWARELEVALSRSFEAVPVGDQHVVFLLDRPPRPPGER